MKQKFNVYGMSCSACVNHVDSAVKNINGVISVNVNLVSNSMVVEYDEKVTDASVIINAVKNEGYDAKVAINKDIKDDVKKENKKILVRIIVSFSLLIPIMYLSMGSMIGLPSIKYLDDINNCLVLGIILSVLTLPVLIINRIYFIRGYKNLFTRKSNMDTLIALGSSASFIYALVSFIIASILVKNGDIDKALSYRSNLYFDSSAMILTLVTLGKFLESLAKKKTTKSIDKLIKLLPEEAIVIEDGKEVIKKIGEIKVGDEVIVRAGERIPIDGIIIKGSASIDTSSITGESIPTLVGVDDKVVSSSLNESGYIVIKAMSSGSDSTMQKLIDLVDEAANSKAQVSRLADKVSRIFVPVVLSIALVTFITWLVIGDLERAFRFGISVLVISCPCALGLATPVAIMVSVGKAAQIGVVNKTAESIETACKIDTVILDKTGTITFGKPTVSDVISLNGSEEELLSIVYTLEKGTVHPLAKALITYCEKKGIKSKNASDIVYETGKGIKATIDGKVVACGNYKYITELTGVDDKDINHLFNGLSNDGKTIMLVSRNDAIIGLVSVIDEIKNESIQAVKELKKLGIEVVMATGDNSVTALAIGARVGIDNIRAQILPVDKAKIVMEYQALGKKVAMIGDGINDSLALVKSDLGIAIGEGSDIAIDYADVVLMRSSLMDAVNAISLSKKTMRVIKFNLLWAFLYNVIAIPIACGVLNKIGITINPMISSIAMSCSSLLVVLTALTINTFKPIRVLENNVNKEREEEKNNMQEVIIKVDGMMCEHCKKRVMEAIMKVENVKEVDINLETKEVKIKFETALDLESVKKEVVNAGYEYLG